jgi:2,4-dienoyl-CoA reductase-like NADH-dependent reductase (Old Yellow Enzyme family)
MIRQTPQRDSAVNVIPIFRRFRFKGLDLPNRIVVAPMTRKVSPCGIPDAQVAEYHQRRAEGCRGQPAPV